MSVNYSPKIVTNGLIYYIDPFNNKCYSGTGSTINDLTSLETSSLYGTASYNPTTKSFDTNSTNTLDNNGITTPLKSITFNDASKYTLDFWVKLRPGITSSVNSLVGRNSTSQWLLLDITTSTDFFLSFREDNTAYNNFTSITDIDLNNWNNFTFVFKSDRSIDLYTNGAFRETITSTTNTTLHITKIGAGYENVNYFTLQGSISATKFYNRNLTAKEIESNYLTLKSRF